MCLAGFQYVIELCVLSASCLLFIYWNMHFFVTFRLVYPHLLVIVD